MTPLDTHFVHKGDLKPSQRSRLVKFAHCSISITGVIWGYNLARSWKSLLNLNKIRKLFHIELFKFKMDFTQYFRLQFKYLNISGPFSLRKSIWTGLGKFSWANWKVLHEWVWTGNPKRKHGVLSLKIFDAILLRANAESDSYMCSNLLLVRMKNL